MAYQISIVEKSNSGAIKIGQTVIVNNGNDWLIFKDSSIDTIQEECRIMTMF